MVWLKLILILALIEFVSSANILFANTWQSKSHALTMLPLAERLHDRGHNVSMYTQVSSPIGKLGDKITNIQSILPKQYRTDDTAMIGKLFWFYEMGPYLLEKPHEIGFQYMNYMNNDEQFLNVVNTCYDLVIVDEMFCVSQAAIALHLRKKCGTKIALFSTTDIFALYSQYRGLSRNPVTYPNYYTKGYSMFDYDPASLGPRIATLIDVLIEPIFTRWLNSRWVTRAGNLLQLDASHDMLFKENLISFIDYPSTYGIATPKSNELIYVGEHCKVAKPLPKLFSDVLEDKTSKGTIYIAFGSIVDWSVGPPETIQTFINVLNKYKDYRVIWSYAGAEIENVPSHILLTKWAPQNDILSHPNTVLFFTHGGLKSLKEGICSKTPMLFLPFFADQPKNALYAIYMGIAEAIYKGNITEVEMERKINKVLESPTMKQNIDKYHNIYLDNVMDSLDLGAYWTEKVLSFNNSSRKYRDIRGKQMYLLEYLYIEAFVVFGIIIYIFST